MIDEEKFALNQIWDIRFWVSIRVWLMIQYVDKTNETKVDDSLDMTRPSKVNIHSVVIVIMLALVVTFLMVIGVSYLYDTKHLKGQSSAKYFCPSSSSTQVGICVKS